MDFITAQKKVQARKVKENYLLINLGYENKILLPYKDGIAFMSALSTAEQFNDPYNKEHSISELDKDKITIKPMSQEEYERYKIAALLNMTVAEVKEMGLQSN